MARRTKFLAGFHPLRPGRIHLWCPKCGRKMSNMARGEHDPDHAAMLRVWCDRCSAGCKVEGGEYYTKAGQLIDWQKWHERRDAAHAKLAEGT